MVTFGTKAETLERLEHLVKKATVLPQIRLSVSGWNKSSIKKEIEQKGWSQTPLIVRSSASQEDVSGKSLAGHFLSIPNIQLDELYEAIDRVISSYHKVSSQDQVFIQPMLQSIRMSGVAFSCDPRTGAPYRIINYDEESGTTDSVTAGTTNFLKVYYAHHLQREGISDPGYPKPICQIIEMLEELESYFGKQALDVEFAVTEWGELFLFQVRPLVVPTGTIPLEEHVHCLRNIESKIKELSKPHPYLYGSRNIFGVMPDWNPAEIIGVRPRSLALSLYKEIITDSIWALQRENYGYRSLKGFPLLIHFNGLPYIDVRVSFNSFIPADIDDRLAGKLVDYYLTKLEKEPHLHDKGEFEIIYSCYTLDLPQRLIHLQDAGFSQSEIKQLTESLRSLTNRIIDPQKGGLFSKDLQEIKKIEERFEKIQNSSLDNISKIYWLLEDCKRYGTLPFAGIARAGFIAAQLLKSLVSINVLTSDERDAFLFSLSSVCSEMQRDRTQLMSQKEFLDHYGHLREGTYDILSSRYDETPDNYFDWKTESSQFKSRSTFSITDIQGKQIENALTEQGLNHNAASLLKFIRTAIEGREYSKFLFTRSLSKVLCLVKQLGEGLGLTLEECSHLDIQDIKKLYSCSLNVKSLLSESIARGKNLHRYTKEILLPPLITSAKDVWSFELKQTEPNYITHRKVIGNVCVLESSGFDIAGKIILIPSADPGYDWIFTHSIAGLITMYGGINSHMAIRSAELGIPAVIGAGEVLYNRWQQAKVLEINCENRTVRVV